MIIAAKCAPEKRIFSDIKRAGLKAVELYLSRDIMWDLKAVVKLYRCFPFKFAAHAPNDCYNPEALRELTDSIGAEAVVFHDIYWEDQWKNLIGVFKGSKARLCVENVSTIDDPVKFMIRYGLGRCLDIEHLEMECMGIYEEEFIRVMKQAFHIHLTGIIPSVAYAYPRFAGT